MFSFARSSSLLAACSIYLCVFGQNFQVPYCSDINTASTSKNSSIYQSNGLCFDFCKQDYAFAVVQHDGCWCSNYVPETTTTGCNAICPGYDIESCGGDGLYGYIQLSNTPSGTRGAPDSSSTTQVSTVTESRERTTTTVILSSSSTTLSTRRSSITTTPSRSSSSQVVTSAPSSSTWMPTPVISLATVTGKIITVTVTPTTPPGSQNLNDLSRNEKGGSLGTGRAVGLTVGLVALVALIGGLVYFYLKRRRQQNEPEEGSSRPDSLTALGGQVPSRSMSEHSRYVLGTDGRQVVEAWEPKIMESHAANARSSRLMPVDPRLDPFAPVYQRGDNKSRESVNTLRDDHDYSRRVHGHGPVLRATNPDE